MIRKAIFILFFLLLIVSNYKPGTFLSIWDTVHSEFNFKLDISRNLFSVWQEYRGLGLLDGMAHAADLPRQILLWITSFVLPMESLRYFYHFAMLFVGAFGIYILIHELILKDKEKHTRETSSILGSLFYLLNLGTIQYFYVPFEAFSTFWGIFPWLIYSLVILLNKPTRKSFLFFLIVNIIAIPSFYIQTIFIVYLFCLIPILLIFLKSNFKLKYFWLISQIVVLTLTINAFWLLPSLYFYKHGAIYPQQGKINQMSTEDTFLQNKRRGTISDFLLMKGYYFDFVEEQSYMMASWRSHLNDKSVVFAGYFLAGIAFIGLFAKNPYKKYVYIPLSISVLAFLSDVFPISVLQSFIRGNSIFFDQLFRSPFTKFIVLQAFSFSIFFAFGIDQLINFFQKISGKKVSFDKIFFGFTIVFLIYTALPVFQGYFFSPMSHVKIPKEYFDLFSFFEKQNHNQRIATLPQSSYWGWESYNWGYRGSGFIWQGLPQATLDRAFDVWRDKNEDYYWEISNTIYSQNQENFKKILEKYQINWLILDENILSFSSQKSLYYDGIKNLISKSKDIFLERTFGKITVYKVGLESYPKEFIFLTKDLPVVGPDYKWNNLDKAYEEYGDYISMNNVSMKQLNNEIYYPFRSLFTGRKQEELEFGVKESGDSFSFKTTIPKELTGYNLVIPTLEEKEVTEIDVNDLSKKTIMTPQIFLDGELIQVPPPSEESHRATSEVSSLPSNSAVSIQLPYIRQGDLEVRVPKINGYFSYNLQPTTYNLQPKSCDQFNNGIYTHESIKEGNNELLRSTSVGSSNCLDFDLPNLSQDIGYLVTVENRNIEGKSLLFSVINKTSQRADIETYLPKNPKSEIRNSKLAKSYFIIPPMEKYGLGYTLHLDNISIGSVETVNDLGKITVNPIPYRFLTSLKIIKGDPLHTQGVPLQNAIYQIDHPNPSLYKVKINNETMKQLNNGTLILSQSFDSGWHAYQMKNSQFSILNSLFPFFFGKEIKDHVMVNNWENGWHLQPSTTNNQSSTIVIVYLPQYLQYLGFLLIFFIPLVILRFKWNIKYQEL